MNTRSEDLADDVVVREARHREELTGVLDDAAAKLGDAQKMSAQTLHRKEASWSSSRTDLRRTFDDRLAAEKAKVDQQLAQVRRTQGLFHESLTSRHQQEIVLLQTKSRDRVQQLAKVKRDVKEQVAQLQQRHEQALAQSRHDLTVALQQRHDQETSLRTTNDRQEHETLTATLRTRHEQELQRLRQEGALEQQRALIQERTAHDQKLVDLRLELQRREKDTVTTLQSEHANLCRKEQARLESRYQTNAVRDQQKAQRQICELGTPQWLFVSPFLLAACLSLVRIHPCSSRNSRAWPHYDRAPEVGADWHWSSFVK